LEEVDDPRVGEPIAFTGAEVLSRLPRHHPVQHPVVSAVEFETQLPYLASELSLFTADVAQPRSAFTRLGEEGFEACGGSHDGRGFAGRLIRLEGLLSVHEMVELPHGESARTQQLAGVPFEVGNVHQPLTVVVAGAERHTASQRAPLEREEADDVGTV